MGFVGSTDFWQSVIQVGLPVGLVAMGVLMTSRSGYLNVGAEGVMLVGAFFGAAGTVWLSSVWLGLLVAVFAGAVANVLVAAIAVLARMGDVLAGLVFDIAMIGFTGVLAYHFFGGGLTPGTQALNSASVLGENPLVYLALGLLIVLEVILRRTSLGLTVRACGEGAEAASVLGVRVVRIRLIVAACAGAVIGVGGAALSVGVVGSFFNDMTNGWGFVAIAVVYFGAWQPFGVLIGALVFGFADSVQFYSGGGAGSLLNTVVLVLPYLVVVALAALAWGQARAPAEETANLEPMS